MKFTTAAAAATTLFSGLAAAEDIQSDPFNLVLWSDHDEINLKKLVACHTSSNTEALCVAANDDVKPDVFYLNTTRDATSLLKGYGPQAKLVFSLKLGGDYVQQPLEFYYRANTNVAHPVFQGERTTQWFAVAEDDGQLAIIDNIDDTTTPPGPGPYKAEKKWYVCDTYFGSYSQTTLNWVTSGKPQNPSCKETFVRREFI